MTRTLTPNEYRAFLRTDFYTFVQRAFHELNPGVHFLRNWHIELIASELEACRQGQTTRLIICVPPRSLKSHCASVAFPAWLLGHDPAAQIICASYGQDLSNKLAMDCRSIMNAKWYRDLFATRLYSEKQAVSEFMTTGKGFRLATSVGGVLTGRGGEFMIIDDPLKPEEALSETQRKAVNEWFKHTLYSRLNDKTKGCIIVIMQRLHEDDLVGNLLQEGGWRLFRFPAIADEDQEFTIRSRYQTRMHRRRIGGVLHPEREPLDVLNHIKERLGEFNFSGQYQQAPAPLGGGLVKLAWFKNYRVGDEPAKFDIVVQSWDTANKATELSDYSVCTSWGKKGKDLYLLHVLRGRLEFPELKRAVHERAKTFNPSNVLIEDKSSGTSLIQQLRHEGLHAVTRYEPKMDKVMRLHSVTSTIENGFVYLPDKAEWLGEYLHEITTFPKGKYDDQCDSTSQALDWFKGAYAQSGYLQWLEREAAKIRGGQGSDSSEACPSCQSHSVSLTGPQNRCLDCGNQWGPYRPSRSPNKRDLIFGGTRS